MACLVYAASTYELSRVESEASTTSIMDASLNNFLFVILLVYTVEVSVALIVATMNSSSMK